MVALSKWRCASWYCPNTAAFVWQAAKGGARLHYCKTHAAGNTVRPIATTCR